METKHYIELTEGLNSLTLEIKRHRSATPEEFRAVYDAILKYQNEFVGENQARADQGLAVSIDGGRLFDALTRWLNAIDTPIGKGDSFLCFEICRFCQDWRNRMLVWFPDLNPDLAGNPPATGPAIIPGNPAFVKRLVNSDAYKQATNTTGDITPPNTWNGSIKDLANWLDGNGLLARPKIDNVTEKITRWKLADGVFLIDGKPITARQLKDGFNH